MSWKLPSNPGPGTGKNRKRSLSALTTVHELTTRAAWGRWSIQFAVAGIAALIPVR